MLNFWKKVREKRISSKESPQINTLDPQYDGPLFGFITKSSDVELEKCQLSLSIKDIFDNKLAYNYFRHYLETKSLTAIIKLLEIMKYESEIGKLNNQIAFQEKNGNEGTRISNINGVATHLNPLINFHEELLKLPDDLKGRLLHIPKGSNNLDLGPTEINEIKHRVFHILEEYWNEFCRSEWYCRYQVELLTSRSVTLGDILQYDNAFSYFMEFLEHEGCQSVIEFWLAATNFEQIILNAQSNSSKYDPSQFLNDAVIIYEKYLSLQATCPLGFSDNVRYAVEEAICDESRGPHPDCFHPAVATVLAFLRSRCLIPFFSSQHYVHLLSDTIGKTAVVLTTNDNNNHSPTSSISDYKIDHTTKPLLSKNDPESVWKYRKQSGLSFGRIDQFGRFQRNLEPDPDKKNDSKITRAVKKWVQKSENKVQEEMAWQVAEMVVKDITNLTMGCHIDDEDSSNDEYEQISSNKS